MSAFGAPPSTSPSSLAATCRSLARPSEKYAASAPVRIAEQTISTNSRMSFQPVPSGTGAPRHEMLESRPYRHVTSAGIEVVDPFGGSRHVADRSQRCSRRPREAAGQPLEGIGRACEQELVVLAAAG